MTDLTELIAPLIDTNTLKTISRIRTTKKGGFVCAVTGHAAGDKLYTYTEPRVTRAGKVGKGRERVICAAYSLPLLLRALNGALAEHPSAFNAARKRALTRYGQEQCPMSPPIEDIMDNPERFFGNDTYEVWRNVKGAYTMVQHTESKPAKKTTAEGGAGVKKSAGKAKAKKVAPAKAKLNAASAYVLGTSLQKVTSFDDIKTLTAKKRALLNHSAVTFIADGKFIVDYVPFDEESKVKQNPWFSAAQGPVLVQPLRSITWKQGATMSDE